jgi:hypothetical protein
MLAAGLEALLGANFFVTGVGALAGLPSVSASIDRVGLGLAFRILVGVVEVAGAAAISRSGTAALGALWLALAMGCAALVHLYILEDSPAWALGLLLACLLVVALRRDQFATLRARFL